MLLTDLGVIMRTLIVFLLLIATSSLYSQTSGWVDSVGFKQQRMKLGEIKQIEFSVTGDTIYSVSKDSLWRLHTWDAKSGMLLTEFTVMANDFLNVFSLKISPEKNTYTVNTLNKDTTYNVKIYDLNSRNEIQNITIIIPELPWPYKYYVTVTDFGAITTTDNSKLLVFYNYGYIYGTDPDILHTGRIQLLDLTHKPYTITWIMDGGVDNIDFNRTLGATSFIQYYFSRSPGGNSTYYCKSVQVIDTLKTIEDINDIGLWYDKPANIQFYHQCFSNDGLHLVQGRKSVFKHSIVNNNNFTFEKLCPIEPTVFLPSYNQSYVIVGDSKSIYYYNLYLQDFTDSLKLSFSNILAASAPTNGRLILAGTDGRIRLVDYNLTMRKTINDFLINTQKTYVDSVVKLTPITNHKYKSYYWDFGDGSSDTLIYTTHRYTKPGIYTVRLVVVDDNGNSDTIVHTNVIKILPTLLPKFSVSQQTGIVPFTVRFSDDSEGSITSWKWDFGDGTTDTSRNPEHSFTKLQYYNITLTITDSISAKTLMKYGYINGDSIRVHFTNANLLKIDRTENGTKRGYNTKYTSALLSQFNKLYLVKNICEQGLISDGSYYTDESQGVEDFYAVTYKNYISTRIPSSDCNYFGYTNYGLIRPYRGDDYIVAGWTYAPTLPNSVTKTHLQSKSKYHGIYSKFSFNFDGCFLPNSSDIYIFRNPIFTSLQFYKQDSILVKKDSLVGDVMRPMPIRDSTAVVVFVNITNGTEQDKFWIAGLEYDTDGNRTGFRFYKKKVISKLVDIIDAGYGEYITCGYVTEKDSAGKDVTKGYLAKIGSGNSMVWEYVSPAWQNLVKLQRLSNGYYMVRGIPYTGFADGFLAFKTNGTILSDSRVQGVNPSFSVSDMIANTFGTNVWLIGQEYVSSQGYRAAIYSCDNPVQDITSDVEENHVPFKQSETIQLTPNPVTDNVTVTFQMKYDESAIVTLYNSIGAQVFTRTINSSIGVVNETISTQSLSPGVFYISVKNGNNISTKPIVVVR